MAIRVKTAESEAIEQTLAKPDIHRQWQNAFRTLENQRFYEIAFDYITRFLGAPENSTFLDAGCGTCAHSIRLAKRGFIVLGIDFSEGALKMAEATIKPSGFDNRIKLQREDLLSLTFENEMFDYILCWGVLMHIPDLEKAISEITRVLKQGGMLVISEGNMFSFQSIILRNLKRLLRKEKADVKKKPAGLEYWVTTSTGKLMTRHANIGWLIRRFKKNGFTVKKHIAGQFTELYTRVSYRMSKNLIHNFNNLWFKFVGIPYLSFGNIIILQKGGSR